MISTVPPVTMQLLNQLEGSVNDSMNSDLQIGSLNTFVKFSVKQVIGKEDVLLEVALDKSVC